MVRFGYVWGRTCSAGDKIDAFVASLYGYERLAPDDGLGARKHPPQTFDIKMRCVIYYLVTTTPQNICLRYDKL